MPNILPSLKQPKVYIPLVIFLILYLALNVWVYFSGPKVFGKKTALSNFATNLAIVKPPELAKKPALPIASPPILPPTPTPIKLKPDNGTKGTYSVSMSKHAGPTVTKVIFDPLDVQKGQMLVIAASLKNDVAIGEVKGTLQMDNGKTEFTFKRTSGTETSGEWQAKVPLNDTVLYKYILTIKAGANNGTREVTIAPRS